MQDQAEDTTIEELVIAHDRLGTESTRTEKQRMYSINFGIIYADMLGHFPFCRSFSFSNDEGAVNYAMGILNDELCGEGVCGVNEAYVIEHRWRNKHVTSGAGTRTELVEEQHRVATLGPDLHFTLHR